MIPNQNSITYENLRPMLIQSLADVTKFGQLSIESLDDDIIFMSEHDTAFDVVEEVVLSSWVHVEPLLPNPELDKKLWELIKFAAKYDLKDGGKEE